MYLYKIEYNNNEMLLTFNDGTSMKIFHKGRQYNGLNSIIDSRINPSVIVNIMNNVEDGSLVTKECMFKICLKLLNLAYRGK